MSRGPKIKTAANTSASTPGFIRHKAIEPTATLNDAAMAEFSRLIEVLRERGTLERVDLSYPTEAARLKVLLDRAHSDAELKLDVQAVRVIAMMTTQWRGAMRDAGLPTLPSRSAIRERESAQA